MGVTVESETKLEVDFEFALPDLQGVVPHANVLPPQRLWSTYFDSQDLRLWARSITLRHRSGEAEGPGIWTLKLPIQRVASRTVRSEHTWVGPVDSVPGEARRILVGILRREPLQMVAELECTRRRIELHDEDGELIGEIDDDSVTVHGGHQDGLRFHEIELEAETADDRVEGVQRRLQEVGARPGSGRPKLSQALSQAEGDGPSDLGRRPTMEDVLKWGIGSSLRRLLDHDYLLRVDPANPPPESIHQARVATRRLRSNLKTVAGVLDPVWVRHTRDDLRWLGSVLGEVRDCDVLASQFEGERRKGAVDAEGQAVLSALLRKERAVACREVARVLDSDRYLTLLDRVHAAASTPPLQTRRRRRSLLGTYSRAWQASGGATCARRSVGPDAGQATVTCTRSASGPSRCGTPPSSRRRPSGSRPYRQPRQPSRSRPSSAIIRTRCWPSSGYAGRPKRVRGWSASPLASWPPASGIGNWPPEPLGHRVGTVSTAGSVVVG